MDVLEDAVFPSRLQKEENQEEDYSPPPVLHLSLSLLSDLTSLSFSSLVLSLHFGESSISVSTSSNPSLTFLSISSPLLLLFPVLQTTELLIPASV